MNLRTFGHPLTVYVGLRLLDANYQGDRGRVERARRSRVNGHYQKAREQSRKGSAPLRVFASSMFGLIVRRDRLKFKKRSPLYSLQGLQSNGSAIRLVPISCGLEIYKRCRPKSLEVVYL